MARATVPPPVHPHACGEHLRCFSNSGFSVGSSPRLWGTQGRRLPAVPLHRFIPTPVGNTTWGARWASRSTVHPHACGEHTTITRNAILANGSSPRLWGTHWCGEFKPAKPRFIPTPVGNTPPRWAPTWSMPVHPHACGEHKMIALIMWFPSGSSPRLWGTPQLPGDAQGPMRFIPTPVGNTFSVRVIFSAESVHPHACGEHSGPGAPANPEAGSSPRLWGTHPRPILP